jgi:pyridinium-3,5-biscarboxylic acid mononucleotide sulfurtransferase
MTDLQLLQRHLLGMGRVMLGYSGGVDSALLAVAGRRALGSERFLAVIGRSASYPEAQWRTALEVARRFDVPLLELETRELDDPRYLRNAPDRCYFCKSELWTRLGELAAARRFETVIDGTNADDLGEHRPGLAAGSERGVRSPLLELGWSKARVRAVSQELGLPTWDAPAAPCLSSRVRYGLEITPERLRQVEQGEAFLRSLGVTGDLRVRHLGAEAKLEVQSDQLEQVRGCWPRVQEYFERLGFSTVRLDPEGYRRGRMLSLLSAQSV